MSAQFDRPKKSAQYDERSGPISTSNSKPNDAESADRFIHLRARFSLWGYTLLRQQDGTLMCGRWNRTVDLADLAAAEAMLERIRRGSA